MVKPRSKGKVWIRYIKIPLREHNEQLYRHYLNQLASKGHETGKSFETITADLQYFYSASRPIKTQTVDGNVDITGEGGINDAGELHDYFNTFDIDFTGGGSSMEPLGMLENVFGHSQLQTNDINHLQQKTAPPPLPQQQEFLAPCGE